MIEFVSRPGFQSSADTGSAATRLRMTAWPRCRTNETSAVRCESGIWYLPRVAGGSKRDPEVAVGGRHLLVRASSAARHGAPARPRGPRSECSPANPQANTRELRRGPGRGPTSSVGRTIHPSCPVEDRRAGAYQGFSAPAYRSKSTTAGSTAHRAQGIAGRDADTRARLVRSRLR